MRSTTKKRKHSMLTLVLALLLILTFVAVFLFFQKKIQEEDAAIISEEQMAKRYVPSIQYQNESYPLKRNVSSLLLIGTDNYSDDKNQRSSGLFANYNIADFLVVLVFDHINKTVTPFQICRDTMCEVESFDLAGKSMGTRIAQINLAHTAGTGKEDSCKIVRDTVERLLFGVPIDYFMSFTMDAVPLINDLVGGVTVTLTQDIPALGENYVAGASITLKGSAALRFVRYRDTDQLDSNLDRMVNHRLYMEGFTVAARSAAAGDPDLAVNIFKKADPFLCTNMSVEKVQTLVNDLVDYEIMPAVYYDGAYDWPEGERWPGYYADENSVFECVKAVFCQ